MLNNKIKFVCMSIIAVMFMAQKSYAEDLVPTYDTGSVAVMEYQVDGSLFQQIADLEQEKVLIQLEKERAQLQLDLERLAAEQKKLQIESEAMDTRAEEQKNKLEADRIKLTEEREKLEQQRQKLATAAANPAPTSARAPMVEEKPIGNLSEKYRLLNVMGAGNQLTATIEDLTTNQRKKISAGKQIDGYNIKSISLDEGVTFEKDGALETLTVGNK